MIHTLTYYYTEDMSHEGVQLIAVGEPDELERIAQSIETARAERDSRIERTLTWGTVGFSAVAGAHLGYFVHRVAETPETFEVENYA